MNDSVLFSRVMEEYGTHEKEEIEEKREEKGAAKTDTESKDKSGKQAHLMQDEERITGSVSGSIYANYFRYAGGLIKLPIILLLLTGYQGAQGV